MIEKTLLPSLKMGMRSSVNVSSDVLCALLETPALHALLDSFSEAIILCDGESRVRFLNPVSYTHLTLPTILLV